MGKERDKAGNGPPLYFLSTLWKEKNNLFLSTKKHTLFFSFHKILEKLEGSVDFYRFIYWRKVGIAHVYLKQLLGLHALFMGK